MFRSKRISATLAAALAVILTACSGGASPATPAAAVATAPTTKQWTVGIDIYYAENTWSVQSAAETKAAVERDSARIKQAIYTDSQGKADKQVSNIEDLIAKHVDGIVLAPIDPTAVVPAINKAMSAGIKVCLAGARVESTNYTCYVNADDKDFGTVGAKWLAQTLGGKGNVIALNGLAGISTSEDRFAGAQEVFAQYPGIKIVGQANADWDYAKGKTAAANLLAANPQIDGVWSQGGEMTRGAIEAFQAANRPLVPMTGEDNNGFLKVWKNLMQTNTPGFDAIGCSKPTWLFAQGVDNLLDALDGKLAQKDQTIPTPTITKETIDQYMRPDMPDALWTNTKLNDDQIRQLLGG
jgi:ribose transport system substrate-binding protein